MLSLLILSLYLLSLIARPFAFIFSQDNLKDTTSSSSDDSPPDPTTPPPIPPFPLTRPSGISSAPSPTHLTSPRTSLTLAPATQSSNLTPPPPPPPRPHPIQSPPRSPIHFTSRESQIWYRRRVRATCGRSGRRGRNSGV